MRPLLVFAAAIGSVALSTSYDARADSRPVAARVAEQWRSSGATVHALASRFIFDDETLLVPLPAPEASGGCAHVAIIGARGLSFHAKLSDVSPDPLVADDPYARGTSHAGVIELRRCDAEAPRSVLVTTEAGRGTLELVVAYASGTIPSVAAIAPERTGGALPPPPEAGALPLLAAQELRANTAEARAKREGATVEARSVAAVADEGGGEFDMALEAGCHRIEVLARDTRADRPGRRYRLDVDAELRDADDDRLLARDRTEAPDAHLETCVGGTTRVTLAFAGALPRTTLLVTHARWPLPARLPPIWGSATRSKMARAMFARHVAVPAYDPIFLGQGSSGTTAFPLQVETGGCYVAVVGITHGRALRLQLHALVGARESSDDRGAVEEAALTSFCVQAYEPVRLEVHARGPALGFGLAVFRVKSGVWEAGR